MQFAIIVSAAIVALQASLTCSQATKGALIWQEEFNTFDKTRWKHLITAWRGGNAEFQYYTNRSENSYVRNGTLYIKPTFTANRYGESFLYNGVLDLWKEGCNIDWEGGCYVKAGTDIINPIQSARIVTSNSFSFTYGIVEVRAQMPKGDWLWPAIWMLPTNEVYGTWPRSGEIDIVEVRGNANYKCNGADIGRQKMGSAMHWGPDYNQNRFYLTEWSKILTSPDYAAGFHIYRLEWLPTSISFYVNNVLVGSVTPPVGGFWKLGNFSGTNIWSSGTKMAPFDQKFHFVINLAVGGNFFPEHCVNSPFPKPWTYGSATQMRNFWEKKAEWMPTWNTPTEEGALKVDWIRVYNAV